MAENERTQASATARRAIWKGTLGFGLLNIPVSLHRAIARREVRFRELHDQDGGRIRRRAVCSIDGEAVARDHIVKGFEIERGRYVTVSPAELRASSKGASRTLAIVDFVDPQEIDPVFYARTYWLSPRDGGERAFAIVTAAMRARRRIAIARLALRTRQHLCAIRPAASTLELSTLLYSDEVLTAPNLPPAELAERELGLAERLVEALSVRFQPERYHDEHRDAVLAYLRGKAECAPPIAVPETPPPAELDITGALEASIAESERHKTAA